MRRAGALLILCALASATARGAEPPETRAPAAVNLSSSVLEPSVLSRAVSRMDLYLTSKLNGQALGRPLGENYSVFARDRWPIYLYHTLDWDYRFDRGRKNVGMELSATQDLVHGVKSRYEYVIEPAFTVYDPQFWYKHNGLLDAPWVRMDAQFSVFPALTSFSRQQTMRFSAAFDTTWNLKLPDYRWTAYLTTRLRPTFYEQARPLNGWEQRERLFASAGHFVAYRLSPHWEVTNSSLFDLNYYADHVGMMRRGDISDDRAQVGLNYYTSGGVARVGAYLQGLVADPRLETSVVGLDITFNFLTARSM